MRKSFAAAAVMGVASLAFVGGAYAQVKVPKEQEFTATPLQHGAPEDLPGEGLVPGGKLAVHTFNLATEPVIRPILAAGDDLTGNKPAAGGEAAPAKPMHHHHHHHMMKKKTMMKKKMMKKSM